MVSCLLLNGVVNSLFVLFSLHRIWLCWPLSWGSFLRFCETVPGFSYLWRIILKSAEIPRLGFSSHTHLLTKVLWAGPTFSSDLCPLTTPHSQLQLNISTRKSQADSEHRNLSPCSITLKTCDSSCPAQVIICRDSLLQFPSQKPVHPLTLSPLPTIMCHQPPCVLSPGQVAPFPPALAPHSSPSS